MHSLLGVAAFLYLVGMIGFLLAVFTAPFGAEDERGFRLDARRKAAPEKRPEATRVLAPASEI